MKINKFLEAIGLTESGVDKLTRAAYHLLGLGTYLLLVRKKCVLGPFKRGMQGSQAAGIIHSDFEKGFIRAVSMSYDDLVKYGSEKAVKEAGRFVKKEKNILFKMATSWNSVLMYKKVKKCKGWKKNISNPFSVFERKEMTKLIVGLGNPR